MSRLFVSFWYRFIDFLALVQNLGWRLARLDFHCFEDLGGSDVSVTFFLPFWKPVSTFPKISLGAVEKLGSEAWDACQG